MEAKNGGFGFDFAGTYTKLIENKLIEYSYGERTAKIERSDISTGAKKYL